MSPGFPFEVMKIFWNQRVVMIAHLWECTKPLNCRFLVGEVYGVEIICQFKVLIMNKLRYTFKKKDVSTSEFQVQGWPVDFTIVPVELAFLSFGVTQIWHCKHKLFSNMLCALKIRSAQIRMVTQAVGPFDLAPHLKTV